eukprot:Gb_38638 [translate_table: standard]
MQQFSSGYPGVLPWSLRSAHNGVTPPQDPGVSLSWPLFSAFRWFTAISQVHGRLFTFSHGFPPSFHGFHQRTRLPQDIHEPTFAHHSSLSSNVRSTFLNT